MKGAACTPCLAGRGGASPRRAHLPKAGAVAAQQGSREQSRRADQAQVQHAVPNRHARAGEGIGWRAEDAIGQVVQGEVAAGIRRYKAGARHGTEDATQAAEKGTQTKSDKKRLVTRPNGRQGRGYREE